MSHRKPNPPRQQAGFSSLDALATGKCADCMNLPRGAKKNHSHGICPDCLDRNAIKIDGRVATTGGQLRGETKSVGRSKKSRRCTNCKGTGAIPLYGQSRQDPYSYGIKPSEALLRRR